MPTPPAADFCVLPFTSDLPNYGVTTLPLVLAPPAESRQWYRLLVAIVLDDSPPP